MTEETNQADGAPIDASNAGLAAAILEQAQRDVEAITALSTEIGALIDGKPTNIVYSALLALAQTVIIATPDIDIRVRKAGGIAFMKSALDVTEAVGLEAEEMGAAFGVVLPPMGLAGDAESMAIDLSDPLSPTAQPKASENATGG